MKTISEINKQLDELFKYWKIRSKFLGDTEALVSDGIMRNKASDDLPWGEKPIRIAFLLKDNPDGEQDTRDWLKYEKNQNLSSKFIHKIANLFYGLSKASDADYAQWWYEEIEQHQEDVKKFFNSEPFAFIECKKQPGETTIKDKVLQNYLNAYKNLLREEIEIIDSNILVCMGQPIFDFVLQMYNDVVLVVEKHVYYVPSCKKIIVYAGHPSSIGHYKDHYDGVMHWYRQFLKSDMYKDFMTTIENCKMGRKNEQNKVSVFGLGGAGCNITKQIIKHNVNLQYRFNYLFCNQPEFSMSDIENRTISKMSKITDITNYDFSAYSGNLTYVIAGLRGNAGSKANILAKMLHQKGCIVIGIGVLPFTFESEKELATLALCSFDSETDATIVLQNKECQKQYADIPINTAFENVDNMIAEIISQNSTKEDDWLARLQETIKKLNNPILSIYERI